MSTRIAYNQHHKRNYGIQHRDPDNFSRHKTPPHLRSTLHQSRKTCIKPTSRGPKSSTEYAKRKPLHRPRSHLVSANQGPRRTVGKAAQLYTFSPTHHASHSLLNTHKEKTSLLKKGLGPKIAI
ncbi:hypothetical protein E2C01_086722 [Portunus trituberculatus]|uniref:Uncharacterized protein n=1 Tax=Portunus trituberculatus TaxID=210409 RepID=A0A5B7JA27_PORTR|nr:hypothetical protein [Portunus trituberculatus]